MKKMFLTLCASAGLLSAFVLAQDPPVQQINNNASALHTNNSALPITQNGSITHKPQTPLKEQSPLTFTMVILEVCVGTTCMQVDPPRGTK